LRTSRENSYETGLDYVQRVNRVVDYIIAHLEQPLPLETIAGVAYFSPFHFHRVFKALMGETLNEFVRRLRLERALVLRSHQPNRSLTEIAFACGFQSSSDFSRSFKKRYGVPPSAFDIETFRNHRRTDIEQITNESGTRYQLARLPEGENPDGFTVQLREIPARTVAYIREADPFRPGIVEAAADRLVAWADARGLADGQWLGYMWDDPGIVARKDCRYDVGIEVPHVEPDGEIGRFDFPAMLVAQVEVRGELALEQRAFDWLFGTWLPRSRYIPDDQPNFEAWIGRPFAHGSEYFELYAQLPVVPG